MLEQFKETINDLPFENVKNELDVLENKLKSNNLNVVLIGEFSAGKSSLINKYYGINLPVNIEPETATIWRIIISDENKIIVKFKNSEEKEISNEEEVKQFNQKDIEVIDYYIKSEENKGLILVDTPGLSSLDDFHKEALEEYIKEADVVLVLSDITQGLTNSTVIFLNNNTEHSQKLYLILTKSDLLSENDKQKSINYAKNKFKFIKSVDVVNKEDISNLKKILEEIAKEKENILKDRVNEKVKKLCEFTIELIKEQIKLKQTATNEELEEKIKKIKKSLSEIESQIRKQKREFKKQLQILSQESQKELEQELLKRSDWIIDALYDENLGESIDDRMQKAIEEALVVVLNNLENKIDKELQNIDIISPTLSNDLVISVSNYSVEIREFLVGFISGLAMKIPQLAIIMKLSENALRGIVDLVIQMTTRTFVRKKVEESIIDIAFEVNNMIYSQLNSIIDELFEESAKELVQQREDYISMIEDTKKKLKESYEMKQKEINKLNEKIENLKKLCGGEK
jgi:predicted GTPase